MRRILSVRSVASALAPARDRLRFVVVDAIDMGAGRKLAEGEDITDMVRDGRMPEGSLRTHVKRTTVVAIDTGNRAGLDALRRLKPTAAKPQLQQAFAAAGIPVPPAMTTDGLHKVRRVVLAAVKPAKADRAAA